MSKLQGEAWLNSRRNRIFEASVVTPMLPFATLAMCVGSGAVMLAKGGAYGWHEAERALLPEEPYWVAKLGALNSNDKASKLLNKTMLDEVPQLFSVIAGQMALVGPRGTLPSYQTRLLESLDPKLATKWRSVLKNQRPGIISSYSLEVHAKPTVDSTQQEPSDKQVASEAECRAEADIRDFTDASFQHSSELISSFMKMVAKKVTP